MSSNLSLSNNLHAVIISWGGQENNARYIATCIKSAVASLTIIYSHSNDLTQDGPGVWLKVSNQFFYGKKFAKALEVHPGGTLLVIHADAQADDWPLLITCAQTAFANNPQLGVWAPRHTNTPWQWQDVCLGDISLSKPQAVAQTDGIVVAYAKPVVERLKQLSYEKNHYGWGIDWAAISFAYCNNLIVLMDPSLLIHHPATTQDHFSAAAFEQMQEFFKQLSEQEKTMQSLLEDHISLKKTGLVVGDDARQKQLHAEQEVIHLQAYIDTLHRSLAWRWARPLRMLRSRIKKFKRPNESGPL